MYIALNIFSSSVVYEYTIVITTYRSRVYASWNYHETRRTSMKFSCFAHTENLPRNFHGKFSTYNFSWNSMEYKFGTSVLQDRPTPYTVYELAF